MKKCEIAKIVFDIDGKKIELTEQQAKKMKEVLGKLFGDLETVEEHHHHHSYPVYPYRPYWYWNEPIVWCNDGTTQMEWDNKTQVVNCSL